MLLLLRSGLGLLLLLLLILLLLVLLHPWILHHLPSASVQARDIANTYRLIPLYLLPLTLPLNLSLRLLHLPLLCSSIGDLLSLLLLSRRSTRSSLCLSLSLRLTSSRSRTRSRCLSRLSLFRLLLLKQPHDLVMYNTDLLVLGQLSFGLIEEFGVCSD
jgi:hypothetical protein